MNLKKRIKSFILYIFCVICIITMIISGYKIIIWCKDNNNNKEIMNKIYEKSYIDKNKKSSVDILELKKMNSETIGWIKVENTNIEYPIVQTSDNDFYLTHSFDKSYNRAGWIYADFRNKLDGTDKNIVIYGHNRKDGSMFGTLKNVLTEEWYNNEENMLINLIIGEEVQKYKVFSAYEIEKEEYYLTTEFDEEKEFEEYINRAKTKSRKDFNTEVSSKDTILTLSTCADNNKYRVVVHAKIQDSSQY